MSWPVSIATSGNYYVGEEPIDPLIVMIDTTSEADNDRDITGLAVSLIGDELPPHVVVVQYPVAGQLAIAFTEAFTESGVYTVQIVLTAPDGNVDITEPFTVNVHDLPSSLGTTIVTPSQVQQVTGVTVVHDDVVKAQGLVSLAAARDLSDPDWLATISTSDEYWLATAVSYQAAELATITGSDVAIPYAPGVQSMSTGDQSITFASPVPGEVPGLVSLATTALRHVSWMQPVRTLHARPFLTERPNPDPWVTLYGGTVA